MHIHSGNCSQPKNSAIANNLSNRQKSLQLKSRGAATPAFKKNNSSPGQKIVQRLNGATPQNFAITGHAADNAECSVTTNLGWNSSDGNLANLADYQSREEVTFNTDPRIPVPAYAGPLPFGMVLAGNVLTKGVGVMSNPGGSDKHSGAAHGPKFTMGGIANLRRAAWTLVGTQWYEVKQNGGAWNQILGPFTITRTMTRVADPVGGDYYELTINKTGPGVNVTAGPTRIVQETTEAMTAVGAARQDQTADWNTAQAALVNQGMTFHALATDTRNNPQGVAVTFDYDYTQPTNILNPAFAPAFTIPVAWLNTILASARSAVRPIIDKVLIGAAPPTRFRITIFRANGVQQQAFWTNENGGTYRVILRADKLMDMTQWGGDVTTSMAGRESRRGWTNARKKKRFAKAVATHELGHMLHAFTSPNIFLTSTLMPAAIPAIQHAAPPDPLAEEKVHIAQVNGRVMQAIAAKNYKAKWGYAQANPGEVVPEVFTAIMHGRKVPKGLAAVYVAYGGARSAKINAALVKSFGGPVPAFNQPEDAIAIINQP